jgi:ribosomal protein S18 acetylase RimI-like enzyme
MSRIAIRPARAADALPLARMARAISATPGLLVSQPAEISDESVGQKIAALAEADNGAYRVAEVEGELVGYGMLDPLPWASVRHVVHLTIAVDSAWQGRGVGRALLASLIDWARMAPAVEKIELHVRASNQAAQALYHRLGFVEVGRWSRRVKVAADDYLDDVAMELLL